MNKRKRIALATAAALAMLGISTVANAAPLTVTVNSVANSTTSAAPQSVSVPSTNVIDAGHSVALTATIDTGTVVSFTASSTVKLVTLLNTVDAPKTPTSGSASYSATSVGSPITVYAYTTSTTTGSVTIVNGSYSTIVYIKGTAGSVAKISANTPVSAAVNTAPTISVSATDVFGNPVGGEAISVTLVGATFSNGDITKSLTTSAVTSAVGVTPVTVLGSVSATLSVVSAGNVTVVATDVSIVDTAVGLPAAVKTSIATFAVSDLDAQIAGLKAQLSAEIAGRAADKLIADKALADAKVASELAMSVAKAELDLKIASYKARFNYLATKWNKKHPTAKVALLK